MQQPQMRKHPGDQMADQYVKELADAGWQIHQAYRKGFDNGSVQSLLAQARELARIAQAKETPAQFKAGIEEVSKYLVSICQGVPYAFTTGEQPKNDLIAHKNRAERRLAAKGAGVKKTGGQGKTQTQTQA
jgi:hypothetical protein